MVVGGGGKLLQEQGIAEERRSFGKKILNKIKIHSSCIHLLVKEQVTEQGTFTLREEWPRWA